MTPFYHDCCKEFNWKPDTALIEKMTQENENKLKVKNIFSSEAKKINRNQFHFLFMKELDSKIQDAEKNLGETEIRETNLAKAEYLSLIADKVT
jgi:26S proteasome regulatory subunit N7